MFSVFSAAGQLSQPQTNSNNLSTQQVLFAATGQQMTQAGTQLFSKNLQVKPTINIRPGARFNVLVTRDVIL